MLESLIGWIEPQMDQLSLIHDWIFTYDKIKSDSQMLAKMLVAKFEYKYQKLYANFNLIEKTTINKEFQKLMKPIYKTYNVTVIDKQGMEINLETRYNY